jgi:hypothetical protein
MLFEGHKRFLQFLGYYSWQLELHLLMKKWLVQLKIESEIHTVH